MKRVVLNSTLGPSPPETLASTFGLKLGERSCICRGCYLNCLSIDCSTPQDATHPCAYLVNEFDRCIVNTAASRAGRIPKFLVDKFKTSPPASIETKTAASVCEKKKEFVAADSEVDGKSSRASKANLPPQRESTENSKNGFFSVDIVSSGHCGIIRYLHGNLERFCPEYKKCTIVNEVGREEFPQKHFLRVQSPDLSAMVEVYDFLIEQDGLLCDVKPDVFVKTAFLDRVEAINDESELEEGQSVSSIADS